MQIRSRIVSRRAFYFALELCLLTIMTLFFGESILQLFSNIENSIRAAIIAALASVSVVVYNQSRSKKREIAEAHRQEKVKIYRDFMKNIVVGVLRFTKGKDNSEKAPKELEESFYSFTGEVILWGSPRFIQVYKRFRNGSKTKNGKDTVLNMDDMLFEIRRELEISNDGLKRGELIGLFMSNPEELLNSSE